MKILHITLLFVSMIQLSRGAAVVIDSMTRSITTQANGSAPAISTQTTSGSFTATEQTNGSDQSLALASQNSILSNDSTFTFSKSGDFSAAGQRFGNTFAPVTLASESLVDVTFTLPTDAAFWISGSYAITATSAGAPEVAWSLTPVTTSGSAGFSGTAASGSADFNTVGDLEPGQYNLQFKASLGNGAQYFGSNSNASAEFTELNFVVSPNAVVAPIPEPTSLSLLGLASALFMHRRRQRA